MAGQRLAALQGLVSKAWRVGVAVLALVGPQAAMADNTFVVAPAIFTSPPGGGGSCTGCHGAPPELDQVNTAFSGDGRGNSPTSPILSASVFWNPAILSPFTNPQPSDTCHQADVGDRFICWFQSVQGNDASAMGPFYNYIKTSSGLPASAGHVAAAQMGQYLVDLMNGSVTPSSHQLSFSNTSTSAGTFPTAALTITNKRFGDLPYSLPSLGADYGLVSDTCSATHRVPGMNTVVHGSASATNTCTITIEFHPQSVGDRTTSLALTFGTPTPDQYVPPPVTITLAGTGYTAPTAAIAALATPVATGTTLSLNGGGSTDSNPAGVISSYAWHITKDGATFTDLTGATPSFVASAHGSYVVRLTVTDQYTSSAPVTRTVLVVDRPVANIAVAPGAPPYYIGNTVTFDGSGSTRQAGDTLNYTWNISPPPGGVAWQIDPSHVTATLVPPGTTAYTITLDVDDQGIHATTPASVTITGVAPPPPHADAGLSRTVLVNTSVALDGTHSSSSNGHAVTCAWVVKRHSDNAVQTVTNASSCSASFTPTVTGDFDVQLTVLDGFSSAQATITITSSNGEVIVDAGANQSVILGTTATLSGSATSGIGDPLTYAWTLTSAPAGSTAVIANPTSATGATLTPDKTGSYTARLTANDLSSHSGFAAMTLTVQPPLSASALSLSLAASLGSSATGTVVLTDNNVAALTLQSITFGGAAPGDYALDASSGCAAGSPIPHATPCALAIRFTPTVVGARNATVSLAYADAGSPLSITLLGTATPMPQGQLASSTWAQAFDDTVLGSNSSKTITLSNSSSGPSSAPVVFSALALTGAAAADYQVGGTCSTATPLAAQATCTLVITFAPSSAGARAATLQITSNASNPLASIALTGNGLPVPVPVLGVSPASLNFGQQTIHGTYPAQVATLTNTGQAPLAIGAITIAGADFSIADASACTGATLAVGASCQVHVAFAPSTVQASDSGTLTIVSNASNAPTTVALLGSSTAAVAPVLAWGGGVTTLDFGTVQAGTVSTTKHIVLTNQGPGGATFTFVNAVGVGASAFSINLGTCATIQPLFPGNTCTIDVAFAPSGAGARTATLQLVSNGSAPAPLALSGAGLGAPDLALSLSTASLDLGTVQMGSRSAPSVLRLSNSGAGNLQVASIAATGAFSVQASTCPAAPFTLQSGAECTVAVVFAPTATGAASGKLSVQSDAQSQPGDVALAGNADAAPELSSGGCSISRGDGPADPTLWALSVLALVALAWRARQRRRDARAAEARR